MNMIRRLGGSAARAPSRRFAPLPRLTLFGRSALLLTIELLANAVCWIVCAILFGRHANTRPILSLALLSWVSAAVIRLSSANGALLTMHLLLPNIDNRA